MQNPENGLVPELKGMDVFGLYNYPRRLEKAIANMEKDSGVSERNWQLIISFSKVRLARGSGLREKPEIEE